MVRRDRFSCPSAGPGLGRAVKIIFRGGVWGYVGLKARRMREQLRRATILSAAKW